jgi:hypothetical protein
MAKLYLIHDGPDGKILLFNCPGCGCNHPFHVGFTGRPNWSWNGDYDKPTFSPSLVVFKDEPSQRCHSFVTDGKIQFLGDCFHDLKNQTVEIPEWE